MAATETMTIRVSAETKRKLERIAAGTRRSKSFLAAEAVSAYVERELAIIDGVHRKPPPRAAVQVLSVLAAALRRAAILPSAYLIGSSSMMSGS